MQWCACRSIILRLMVAQVCCGLISMQIQWAARRRRRALRRAITPDWCARYPVYEEGKAILARYFGVSTEKMLFTSGVDDAIKLICDTFVEPGDVLAIPSPTFPIYQFFHELAGGRTRLIHYD